MSLHYLHYDVFTSDPLSGNQLAVFLDGRGVADRRMQAIALEMNFSESTFVLPPEREGTDVRVRIFTPRTELPIAGHPTVGTAFALAETGRIPAGTPRVVFGLNVGPTPIDLEWMGDRLRFVWMTQPNPEFGPEVRERAAVAAALGLEVADLAEGLPLQVVSTGVPYLLAPLRDRAAVDRAVSDAAAFARLRPATGLEVPIYLFALAPAGSDETAYSRMFAPTFGIPEDPATGSAAGPLGSYLVRHGLVAGDAARRIVSLQGVAMGRASRLHVAIEGDASAITQVKVGGVAVLVGKGEIVK